MANGATQDYSCPTHARKKSYIKACRKAASEGVAKYRGIYLSPKELGMREVSSEPGPRHEEKPLRSRRILRTPKPKFELGVLSWNAGGLTSRYFDELISLLETPEYKKIRMVSVQETHWSTSSVFSKGNWHIVTSSDPQGRRAGVMTLIHKSLCTLSDIRSVEHAQGRLHQVRIPWQNSHIHIVTGYQHVWQSKLAKDENIKQRKSWTEALSKCMSRIPQRDRLYVCADFNSTAKREAPCIGPCALPNKSKSKQHLRPINSVCRDFNLTALNTFSCKKPHTFQNGRIKTQIDFILTRQRDAGHKAKQARPVHSFPIGITRQGPKHSPIRAELHVPPYRRPSMHQAAYDIAGLEASFRSKDARWTSFSAAVSDAVVQASQQEWQEIELAMLQTVEQHFPKHSRRVSRASISPDYWHKHKILRQLKAQGQECLEEFNRLKAEIDTDIRQHKKIQQERRRAKQEELLQAACSDKQMKSHRLSKALKSLAPWKPPEKISLRDPQGRLLSEQAEAELMHKYAKSVFCKSGGLLQVEQPQMLEVTAATVMKHTHSIPIGKAVPRNAAPVAAWRSMNEHAAEAVANKLAADTGRASLNTHLKDPYVSWLPKPNKTPSKPENLRPIGVLSVPAKILAGVVREEVSSTVQNKAQNSPQFAYLKRRGTREAILHAVKHIEEAKALAELGQRRRRLHVKHERGQQILGSLILSLDLSKAFDSVNRAGLMQALEDLGVEESTRSHVRQLHENTTYYMTVSGVPIAVSVTSGIKQGCKLAPILWSALTLALLDQLAANQGLTEREVNRLITLFADDFLAKGHFRSVDELEALLGHFEALFDLLQKVGLVTNPGKSMALFQVQGTQAQAVREIFTRKGPERRELCISHQIHVPICKSIVYLGVVLAFGNYQDLTVKHRLKQAKEKFRMVRRILRSSRILNAAEKLAIWQSQVVSSMLYGLASIGLTAFGLRLLGQRFSANVRYIFGDHQIHRQHTTHQLVEKYGIAGPCRQVQDRMGGLLQSLEDSSMESQQPMKEELHQLMQDKFAQISMLSDTWEEEEASTVKSEHTCSICGGIFQTWPGLVRHHKAQHRDAGQLRKGPRFDIRLDSLNGTPSCQGCNRQLSSILQLRTHVESGACPQIAKLFDARKKATEQTVIPEHLQEIYSLRSRGPDAILSSGTSRVTLKNHCALCGQYIVGHKGIKQHLKQVHGETWELHITQVQSKMQTHKILFKKGNDCRYCAQTIDAPGRHAEQCVVLLQTYLMIAAEGNLIEYKRKDRQSRAQSSEPPSQLQLALTISFANPHQICYANSVWGLLLHCHTHTVRALNSFQRVWHAIKSRINRQVDLTQLAVVRNLSEAWRLEAIQEDAVHYLQHILQTEGVSLLEWEARVELSMPRETLVEDRGKNIIMLETIEQGRILDVQTMLEEWSNQARVHGITSCGEILLVQIPRYVSDHKDHRPCCIPEQVQAPVFQNQYTQIDKQEFRLIGGLLHLGEEPRSGHYRHFMVANDRAYLGDDFQFPQPVTLTDPLVETNVYLIAYQRQSSTNVAGRDAPTEEAHGD